MIISFDTFGAWATAVKEAKQEQEKNITITENGTGSVLPDSGKTLSKVDYTVNVPQKEEQTKSVTITTNGLAPIYPDPGKVISYVEVQTDVHPTEKLTQTITENGTTNLTGEWKDAAITVDVPMKEEQTKAVTITENGTTSVTPDAGKVLSSVDVIVNVAGGATKVDVGALRIKLSDSTFTEVPDVFDFSNCIYMDGMFQNCPYLTTVPAMDTSKCVDMTNMFYYCPNLTTIPQLDTSKVTNMSYMFNNCSSLTEIPLLDTSQVVNMQNTFSNSHITTIPQLNTSNVEVMDYLFSNCYYLVEIPVLDTSKVRSMNGIFFGCHKLTTVPLLDITNASFGNQLAFNECSHLTTLKFKGGLNETISFVYSPLNEESLKSVLTAASNTTNTDAKTLTFKTDSTFTDDAEGTWAALVADCTTKGWTINNLTITPAA